MHEDRDLFMKFSMYNLSGTESDVLNLWTAECTVHRHSALPGIDQYSDVVPYAEVESASVIMRGLQLSLKGHSFHARPGTKMNWLTEFDMFRSTRLSFHQVRCGVCDPDRSNDD